MTPERRPEATRSLTARLAHDLGAALGTTQHPGTLRPGPWGLHWGNAVVATAVPSPSILEEWRQLRIIAASPALAATLATLGADVEHGCDPPLLPLPDRSLTLGPPGASLVRCDDEDPPERAGVGIGAFFLCWALDVPSARLVLGTPASVAAARALGCPVEAVGAAPAVVVCAGAQPCPPPLVLDALAAAIPIAGRRTPALVDVVGDAAVLVEPAGGVEALAGAVAALLADPAMAAEIGGRGPGRVLRLSPADSLRRLAERLSSED